MTDPIGPRDPHPDPRVSPVDRPVEPESITSTIEFIRALHRARGRQLDPRPPRVGRGRGAPAEYDRLWNLADVFGALRGAGVQVEHLGEHPETYWDSFPRLQDRYRGLIPQTFTMPARRP